MDNSAYQGDTGIQESVKGKPDERTKLKAEGLHKDEATVRMKREINLLGAVSLIVGTMIGSGIFISPNELLKDTNSVAVSLIVWVSCGVLATLAALSYGELGTVVPKSGGEHAYYMEAFTPLHRLGEIPAFMFALMTIVLLKPSSLSIASLSFAGYTLRPLLEALGFCNSFIDSADFQLAEKLLACIMAVFVTFLNIMSVRLATRIQIIFTVGKISSMALLIGIGIYNMARGEWGALTGEFDSSDAGAGKIATSFYSGLWAYDGWNNLNFVTEELKNPSRNLPLSIIIGIPLVTVLYLLCNVAYLTVLSKSELQNSSAVAVDVANAMLGKASWIIPVLVALSTIGTANGSMFTAARISYVAGRDGHMLDVVSYVHAKRLTPTIALILNCLLAIPMMFFSNINDLIGFFSFASWIYYGLALSCVLVLRKTKPDSKRPFRVPIIIPALAILMSIYLVLAPLIDEPQLEYFYILGFIVFGLIIYVPFVYMKKTLPGMEKFTKTVQCLTLVAPSPYKED